MRIAPALVCLGFLLSGCGGGGGGIEEPTAEGPLVPAPPADPLVVARRILEGCLQPDVERLLDLFADLEATLASGGATPQPTVSLGAVNLLSNAVAIEVDLDVDGVNDLAATIRLAQGNGQPALSALAFAALAAQVTAQDFESALAALPDGTHALVEFETLLPPMTTGVVDFLVAGGTISQASGLAEVASGDCRSTFSFDDVPASAILNGGTYPTMLVNYVLVDPEGTVTGTIDLDGTNLAAVTAHYLGTVSEYTLDLASGVLTPVVP